MTRKDPRTMRLMNLLFFVCGLAFAPDGVAAEGSMVGRGGDAMPEYTDSVNLRVDASLTAVDFADERLGLACGDHGAIWRSTDGGVRWTLVDSGVTCRLEDVVWLGRQHALIVGGSYDPITRISRGVVLLSHDGGLTWQRGEDEELPKLRTLKFETDGTIIASGDWSNSLLTDCVESSTSGRTWDGAKPHSLVTRRLNRARAEQWVDATKVATVVRDVCRVDDQVYCSVGDHGIIQRSVDGGRVWSQVHGSDRRTCLLVIARDARSVAWSLIGNEALENRNRTALLLTEPLHNVQDLDVSRQVMSMVGGSAVDSFRGSPTATRESEATRETETSRETEASRETETESAVLAWLKIHRPLVVALGDGVDEALKEQVLQLATRAGVARIVHYSFTGGGNMTLHRDALLARTGILASDVQLDAMHLVAPDDAISNSLSMRFAYDLAANQQRGDSLTSALAIGPKHRLEATPRKASRRSLQMAQGRIQQTKRVADFASSRVTASKFRTSLRSILDQTSKQDQFRVAWSILMVTRDRSDPELQRITLEEIAERFADQSCGQWADLRTRALSFSREWSRVALPAGHSKPQNVAVAASVPVSPFQDTSVGVRQASAVVPLLVPDQTPDRSPNSSDESQSETAEVDLNWEFHPLVLLSRDAARRRGDDETLKPAEGLSADLARLADGSSNPWGRLIFAASREVAVQRAETPPHLDGVLDDSCWQTALPQAGKPMRLRLAYDESYLYAAIEVASDRLRGDSASGQGGVRDQNLTEVDRVRIRLDTDRDLMTSMQLQVSAGGRTHDSVDGNPIWQPTWFVDTQRSEDKVVIELAISRHDLADLPIPVGEIWFVSIDLIPAGMKTADPLIPDPTGWNRAVFQP